MIWMRVKNKINSKSIKKWRHRRLSKGEVETRSLRLEQIFTMGYMTKEAGIIIDYTVKKIKRMKVEDLNKWRGKKITRSVLELKLIESMIWMMMMMTTTSKTMRMILKIRFSRERDSGATSMMMTMMSKIIF